MGLHLFELVLQKFILAILFLESEVLLRDELVEAGLLFFKVNFLGLERRVPRVHSRQVLFQHQHQA